MDSTGPAGLTVVRRMVFVPGARPCLKLIVPAELIAELTVEQIVDDLRTAASLCDLPETTPRPSSLLPGVRPRPRRACTLQIVDGSPTDHWPEVYLDAYGDNRHTLSCTEPGQRRSFHKHVLASLTAMRATVEPDGA